MAEGEDIQPLVCDNGTGMVKVSWKLCLTLSLNRNMLNKSPDLERTNDGNSCFFVLF